MSDDIMTKKVYSKRLRSAHQTDQAILHYLKNQETPVTFYNLYKDLNFSSGKAQTAIKRLQERNKVFLKKRIKRLGLFLNSRKIFFSVIAITCLVYLLRAIFLTII